MTRRTLLSFAPAALAQTALPPYPGVRYREYARVWPDYLRSLARAQSAARVRALAKLATPDAIRGRQRWVRETFWKLAGGQPERTPLDLRSTGGFERDGYRVEKLLYESRPGLKIPALLYLPKSGSPPYPGVLFQMGHSLNGKAADSYQRCCQGLVKLGFAVLAFDPMGQGERTYYPDAKTGLTRLGSADEEHTLPGRQMLLYGDTSTRLQTWDAVRSLDVLAAHPLVDAKRLGSTGQSGGGTLTMFLIAADDRLASAVVCSGNTENLVCEGFDPPGSTDDAEQNFVGGGPEGFDRWDTLWPFAPKPLLITVSDKDFFGTYSPRYIADGWREFQRLRGAYRTLGAAANLRWDGTPLPHGMQYDTRLLVYDWFRRHLQGREDKLTEEPPVAPEPDRTIWVTERGLVDGATPHSLVRARKPERRAGDLRKLLGVDPPLARFTVLKRIPARGIAIEAVEVESTRDVFLPAWLFLPEKTAPDTPVTLALEPAGRVVKWRETEPYQRAAAAGAPVCLADVRGIGELVPEVGRGAPRYTKPHNDEEHWAWASLALGKPVLGQRVTDILAWAAALRGHPALKGRPLKIAAWGKMTPPAICAAALDNEIAELELHDALFSFQSLVEMEEPRHPFANYVPGLLLHTDLPEIAASLAPRKVTGFPGA